MRRSKWLTHGLSKKLLFVIYQQCLAPSVAQIRNILILTPMSVLGPSKALNPISSQLKKYVVIAHRWKLRNVKNYFDSTFSIPINKFQLSRKNTNCRRKNETLIKSNQRTWTSPKRWNLRVCYVVYFMLHEPGATDFWLMGSTCFSNCGSWFSTHSLLVKLVI